MPRNQQVVRQWKLLRLLERAPRGVSISDVAGEDPARQRTFYRDLEALEQAGFPLYPDDIDGQRRWLLTEAFRRADAPPLPLTEVLALRCARSALETLEQTPFFEALQALINKLDASLSPPMREFARQMDLVFVGDRFGHPDYAELRPFFEALRSACEELRTVELRYRSQQGAESTRRVDPYNIWLHRGLPYLVAWCHLRREIRTFALSRIVAVKLTEERFTRDPAYSFDDYARQGFRIMRDGAPTMVRIWFAPEAALYICERTWHPSQQLEPAPDGAVVLSMTVQGLTEVASWVLSFGPRARVLAPEVLAQRIEEQLRLALGRYGGGGESRSTK